jgi:AcrR family transcriptional regulator
MSALQEDLRVRRTRKLLWEALMAELSERAFEEITVKELCERAMVHRTTFYQHYEDKYALLEQGMREMYALLVAEVTALPGTFSPDQSPPYYVQLFRHVAEYQHFYRVMLCGERSGKFQQLLKQYIVEQTEAKIRALYPSTKEPAIPPDMDAQFFAGGLISTLAWWLEQGMPYSPQQMAHYLQCYSRTF